MSRRRRDADDAPYRQPPAFQEYGSDLLGLEAIKLMTLAERGLFATLRWYVWQNDSVPADPTLIARLLGLDPDEVAESLTDRVRQFFKVGGERLVCPELAAQKQRLIDRREKMAEGARQMQQARKTQGKTADSHPAKVPAASLQPSEKRGTALRRTELRSARDADKRETVVDPFVAEYERTERAA